MSNSSLNISQDVGGGTGYNFAFAAIHGGRAMDQQVMVNGMSVTSLTGTGGTRTNWSDGTAQEYGLQLAAHSAEIAYGGVFANILPRDGGNRMSGDMFANFANEDFQADNLDDELRSQGLTVVNQTKKMVDVNPSIGGPLRPRQAVVPHRVPLRRHRQLRRRPLLQRDADGVDVHTGPVAPRDQRSGHLQHHAQSDVADVAQ